MVEEPEEPKRADEQPVEEARKDTLLQSILAPTCDLCGSAMLEWHCRIMCPMCGYQRDCTDP